MSASPSAPGAIWVGTNNGLIQLTRDHGATWTDVSIAGLPNDRADVSSIDASHHDPATAYVAIDSTPPATTRRTFYRTHDYGKTWTKIVNGMRTDQASGSFARVVRTDTKRTGLLFAGTESSMYVSFDDGDDWQSLSSTCPTPRTATSQITDNDLVVGTYGRSIWILDDYSPLRQVTPAIAAEPAHLFKPGDAIRVRRNVNGDTPFPPEVPHADNPPLGAVIYYSPRPKPHGDITLDVLDAVGAWCATCRARRSRRTPIRRRQCRTGGSRRRSRCPPGRDEPRQLEYPLRRSARRSPQLRAGDGGRAGRHAGDPRRSARAAGHVHRPADGRRQELHADGDGQERSPLARHARRAARAARAADEALRRRRRRRGRVTPRLPRCATAWRQALRAGPSGEPAQALSALEAKLTSVGGNPAAGGRGFGRWTRRGRRPSACSELRGADRHAESAAHHARLRRHGAERADGAVVDRRVQGVRRAPWPRGDRSRTRISPA